jgi:class 3 adenylate cyclase
MQCSKCGHDNRKGAKFCEECAAPLVLTCASCGTQLSPAATFCPECGHPTGVELRKPRFAAPENYTPVHLAEKILTSKAALEGERKQVTVLFADLKGSMELLADRDPEEARKILDPVLERMMDAVHRFEGTVNQVMGDGIMALFGAPLAHEDHAVRGCYAALRMQEGGATLMSFAGRRALRCESASASTPVTSWCAPSAAICAWTTRPWARLRTWRRAWSSSRPQAASGSPPPRCA